MKNYLEGVKAFLVTRLSSTLGKAVLGLIIAEALLRFPVLTSWLDKGTHDSIMSVVYEIKSWAWGFILLFAKSYNQTGGTVPITVEAQRRAEDEIIKP